MIFGAGFIRVWKIQSYVTFTGEPYISYSMLILCSTAVIPGFLLHVRGVKSDGKICRMRSLIVPSLQHIVRFVLDVCNRIDPSITTLSERVILLGETGLNTTSDLTRYITSAAKFAAWKERNSHQFNTAMKTPCLQYFKTYVSNRLNLEFFDMDRTQFQTLWCVNGILGRVTGSKFVRLL